MIEYSYAINYNNVKFLIREGRDFDVIVAVIRDGRIEEMRPWPIKKETGEEVARCYNVRIAA